MGGDPEVSHCRMPPYPPESWRSGEGNVQATAAIMPLWELPKALGDPSHCSQALALLKPQPADNSTAR